MRLGEIIKEVKEQRQLSLSPGHSRMRRWRCAGPSHKVGGKAGTGALGAKCRKLGAGGNQGDRC